MTSLQSDRRIWVLLLLWLAAIALLSSDSFSATNSARMLRMLVSPFHSPIALHVREENLVLRKLGHVVLYGTLAIVGFAAFRRWLGGRRVTLAAMLALALCGTAAAADEYHQHFLLHRTGLASDVVLNLVSGLLSVTVFGSLAGPARDKQLG